LRFCKGLKLDINESMNKHAEAYQSPLQQNGVALTIIETLINNDKDDDIGYWLE